MFLGGVCAELEGEGWAVTNAQKNWLTLVGFIVVAGGAWALKEHLVERGVAEQMESDRQRAERIEKQADEIKETYRRVRTGERE